MGEMTDRQLLELLLKNQEAFQKNQEEFRKENDDIKSDLKAIQNMLENDISPSLQLLMQLNIEDSKRLIRIEKSIDRLIDLKKTLQ